MGIILCYYSFIINMAHGCLCLKETSVINNE